MNIYIYMYYCLSGWQRSLFFLKKKTCKCSLGGKDGKSFGKGVPF